MLKSMIVIDALAKYMCMLTRDYFMAVNYGRNLLLKVSLVKNITNNLMVVIQGVDSRK